MVGDETRPPDGDDANAPGGFGARTPEGDDASPPEAGGVDASPVDDTGSRARAAVVVDELDAATASTWWDLAERVVAARSAEASPRTNPDLDEAATREPQAPTSPAFRLWIADNLAADGDLRAAAVAYDACLDATTETPAMTAGQDLVPGCLTHKAQALRLVGDAAGALATYRELAEQRPDEPAAHLEAGAIAEGLGDLGAAARHYEQVATTTPSRHTDDPTELARRARARLDASDHHAATVTDLADRLTRALERRDARTLRDTVSSTHFAVGPTGGHTSFEELDLLDALVGELSAGDVRVRRALLGAGGKRYLPTSGWDGSWFHGELSLILTRAPRGWQWTGIALSQADEPWLERWAPTEPASNQPLPFELLAPWPRGQCFTAGGLREHLIEAAIVAGSWPFSALVAAGYAAASCCGWGLRGFYYNTGPTHSGNNAFAIDFTRYRRFVPYDNESGGTPVLAAREGIVSRVRAGRATGDPDEDNRVEIEHADPGAPNDLDRFTSKYLHLEGPFRIPVSEGMPVRVGTYLGPMDDTGNSVLDHLHFSIHDRDQQGRSVRPSPMSGVTLGDDGSNTCVTSTNVDYRGANQMIHPSSYAGQNWLVVPVATAVSQSPPRTVRDQRFQLMLSGVAIIDLEGNSGAQWLRETVRLMPHLFPPLQHLVESYGVPLPSQPHSLRFQVEQWVPHATLSSMFNRNHSVNSGFAVDVWRPHTFATDTDVESGATIDRLFDGIQVDVAVRDTDAMLHRLSYHVTLVGRIRFGQPIIID
jgi:tetratricopeptide (TPR) repeat protein